MTKTKSIILGCALMGATQLGFAEIAGMYASEVTGTSGTDTCTLSITAIDIPAPQFGDAYWRIESRGPSSCMWDSVGISHSTELVAGSISLPPLSPRGLVHMKWVFGPASNQVDVKLIGADGGVLDALSYMRQ